MTEIQTNNYMAMAAYVKSLYPNTVFEVYFPMANVLLFYKYPNAETLCCCHINRLNGSYIISTAF